MVTVAIASDFAGFELKETVKAHLCGLGYEIMDVGQQTAQERGSYLDAGVSLGRVISEQRATCGVVFCGTGGGVSIVANKFKGVYCVACESRFTAPKSRIFNNANVLALGGRVLGGANACEIVESWLSTSFCQDFDLERQRFIGGLFRDLQVLEETNFK